MRILTMFIVLAILVIGGCSDSSIRELENKKFGASYMGLDGSGTTLGELLKNGAESVKWEKHEIGKDTENLVAEVTMKEKLVGEAYAAFFKRLSTAKGITPPEDLSPEGIADRIDKVELKIRFLRNKELYLYQGATVDFVYKGKNVNVRLSEDTEVAELLEKGWAGNAVRDAIGKDFNLWG